MTVWGQGRDVQNLISTFKYYSIPIDYLHYNKSMKDNLDINEFSIET